MPENRKTACRIPYSVEFGHLGTHGMLPDGQIPEAAPLAGTRLAGSWLSGTPKPFDWTQAGRPCH